MQIDQSVHSENLQFDEDDDDDDDFDDVMSQRTVHGSVVLGTTKPPPTCWPTHRLSETVSPLSSTHRTSAVLNNNVYCFENYVSTQFARWQWVTNLLGSGPLVYISVDKTDNGKQ